MTKPTTKVKPYDYQPSKAEHNDCFHADTTPENLACSGLRQVKLMEDPTA